MVWAESRNHATPTRGYSLQNRQNRSYVLTGGGTDTGRTSPPTVDGARGQAVGTDPSGDHDAASREDSDDDGGVSARELGRRRVEHGLGRLLLGGFLGSLAVLFGARYLWWRLETLPGTGIYLINPVCPALTIARLLRPRDVAGLCFRVVSARPGPHLTRYQSPAARRRPAVSSSGRLEMASRGPTEAGRGYNKRSRCPPQRGLSVSGPAR